MRIPRITAAAVAMAALTCALLPAAASADDHSTLVGSYSTLSGAMLNMYAEQSGQSLQSYLADQKLLLVPSALPATTTDPSAAPTGAPANGAVTGTLTTPTTGPTTGTSAGFGTVNLSTTAGQGTQIVGAAEDAGTLPAGTQVLQAPDLNALNDQLSAAGISLNTTKFTSLSALAAAVTKSAQTPDGAVTLAAAKWAQDLANLRMPALLDPTAKDPGTPTIPADALPFGLLMNKSLTNLVSGYPSMIAAAQKSGLGSPALAAAWNTSMTKAFAATSKDLSTLLPNQCVGDMMSVMASGSAASAKGVASGNCSPECVTAGQYLHNSSQSLFNNQIGSLTPNVTNPVGGVLNSSSLSNMSSWAQTLIQGQNTQLTGSPFSALGGGSGSCGAAATQGAKAAASSTLPGVFSQLSKK